MITIRLQKLTKIHRPENKSYEVHSRENKFASKIFFIKKSFQCQLNSLRIPLLLTNELLDSMTAPWCLKRAELVMKCVKGKIFKICARIPTVKLKIPGKPFLKVKSRTFVTFKL